MKSSYRICRHSVASGVDEGKVTLRGQKSGRRRDGVSIKCIYNLHSHY